MANLENLQLESKITSSLKEIILLSIAVLILSLAPILIKFSENEISSNATVFNRLWIAALTIGLWKGIEIVRDKRSLKSLVFNRLYTLENILILLLLIGLTIISFVFWAWSLTQVSVANSNLLHNMTPIFATLGGWLFLGHCFDKKFVIGLVLALGGTIVIGIEDFQVDLKHLIGDSAALFSALLYAGYFLVIEKLRANFSATTILFWLCAFSSLFLLPVLLITEDRLFPISLWGWFSVISLGIICQVLGQGIVAYSLKNFSSGFISIFLLMEPFIAAILAWFIFGEKLEILNWTAFFIVLIGIYLAKSSAITQSA
ncbi:MAG: DMT family transporter [Microcoleaceae cyanobacterium]